MALADYKQQNPKELPRTSSLETNLPPEEAPVLVEWMEVTFLNRVVRVFLAPAFPGGKPGLTRLESLIDLVGTVADAHSF